MNATHVMRGGALALCLAAGVLAGCGGGGSMPAPHGAGGGDNGSTGQSKYAEAKLTIVIPEKTSANGKRRPAYISPSTAWLAWTLDGAQQSAVALSTTASPNPNCTGSGSSTVCTVPFYVAPGTHSFVFTLEDASFRALSTGTATNVTLTAGVANTLNLTLGGIPAGISVSSSNTNFTKASSVYTMYGTGSVTLAINAVDAAGNTIVGGGAPSLSASLASASPAPSPAPSATLVAGTGNTWTLTSSFQPSSPTQGTAAVLKVQASPAGSGIAAFSSQFSVLFYTPRIYVAQSGSGSVTSYDEQGNAQSTTITGLAAPQAVSYGPNSSTPNPLPSSYLYVGSLHVVTPTPLPTANATAGPTPTPYGSIAAYNIDGSSPSGLGSFSNAGVPVGVAFDTNLNELYALNSLGSALQVYSASGSFVSTAVASITNPTGIAFDGASDDLYVSTSGSVVAYHENGSVDGAVSSFSSLSSPSGIAYDPALNELFVLNRGNSTVTVYSPSGGAPLTSFGVVSSPTALMFDPYVRWIYVANSSSIRAYSESGTLQTLSGSWSSLSTPTSLTVVL